MKYFTKEVKIALTAIVALVLLFIGINFLKGVNVFESTNTYYVKFKNVNGLCVSNPVYANGYPVGIVRAINYDYQRGEHVMVTVELDDDMRVPKQTTAELESELMGGVKMMLILGPNPADNLAPRDTIIGGLHHGTMDKVGAMVPAVEKMLPKLDSILTSVNILLADPALTHTLHNAEAITADLKQTSARLNQLMQNEVPSTLTHLNRTAANAEQFTDQLARVDVEQTIENVNHTVQGVQQLTSQLNGVASGLDAKMKSTDNTLGLFLNDTSVYDRLNATLGHADSLMIDLKAHPKRYVHFSVFGKKDK